MSVPVRHPKNWRELRMALADLGARNTRTRGSHETWRFDDGRVFVVVRNHLGASVPAGILMKFRRLYAPSSGDKNPDPVLLGRGWGRGGLTLA